MINRRYKLVLHTLVVVAAYLLLPNNGISQNADSSNYIFISRSMLPSEKEITDTILKHAIKINGSISRLCSSRAIERDYYSFNTIYQIADLDFQGLLLYYIYDNNSIDSIIYYKSLLTIYAAPISIERNFIGDGYCDSFIFVTYSDIYSTFFKYPEVNAIQVFIDHVPSTSFPVKSDAIVNPEGNIMYKDWYFPEIDYDDLFFELFRMEGRLNDYHYYIEKDDILKTLVKLKQ